ncbi:PREDICTED: receptor-like kinase LIP2 [Tarenaya hassleriana]|uniref:receptor-like kinase LIP2 n=1 Tax=Tarenaya hassleriana TaxID=28532 RepID=UPI00053CA6D5|nr:PREDICTED: receptor-like kinase LIP2 [Tarenaya hassleriana]XP_010521207.1 PREDICTED: receptor-like kinase LIP2 [Tarenaya hassleriana]XP_010521216.1 PREDICTED: receptor-like kinase LIP2 [Tarenaya hassleriana]XP_010521224.1 PREDICTED: receptor-like kinase LIP2 [Tarenaya hassleriana]
MKSAGDGGGTGVDGGGCDNATAEALVIVGVKPDERRREVLTWALVNVARPGDRIVALHVLDYAVDGSASLISLVRTFDSMLGVYESFCNLKQVDLKLKVCRGKSARKILVEEAKSYRAASLIVGSSRKHHTIRSSASVAKYCARNLVKDVSVFAVKSGKIMFRRVSSSNGDEDPHMDTSSLVCVPSDSVIEVSKVADRLSSAIASSRWMKTSCSSSLQCPENSGADDSLALVPIQANEDNSGPLQSKPGWPFLRRLYVCKRKISSKISAKMALLQWGSRLRGRHSASVIHPDKKLKHSVCDEDCSYSVDGEDGSILRSGSESVSSPLSPCNGLNIIPQELEGLHERYSSTCRLFTYEELSSVTSNFSSKNLIGEGGSSYVYRGCLSDGRELAIKILKPSLDVLKEFLLEIEVITSIQHKNIISLFGFCFENNNLILVYDYLPKGSLEENLHGNRTGTSIFGWLDRYKVAIGIAEALDYLHNDHDPAVIHRDVKSSNVLLSDDFEPQLSDFGFASTVSNASQHIPVMGVAGTFGYLAPEYFMHGKVTEKIDVYAFGVVLLELLSGRKPICSDYPKGQESLVMWAKPILESGKFSQLLDPNLESNENNELIEKMVLAATLCIRRTPHARPQISLVLKILQGDEEATEWGKQQVEASEEEEVASPTNIESHINLALLDLEDEANPDSSPEATISVEEYLKGRWSRTTSFQLD